jgi:hypothetical protein
MSVMPRLPDDPGEFQRLFDDLLRRNEELRQQAQTAQQQAQTAQQQAEDAERRLGSNVCLIRPRRTTTS